MPAYSNTKGLQLLQELANQGLFIFTVADAEAPASKIGISENYLSQILSHLERAGWIVRLRRGLYAGTGSLPGGVRVHPFAIATRLVKPSAISHWSAMSHHGFTDQIPHVVTALTPQKVVTRTMRESKGEIVGKHAWEVAGVRYEYVSVVQDHFFGIADVWIDEHFRVSITDKERTILETFISPRYFGGIGEALQTLEEHVQELELGKLVGYAVRYGKASVAKRLGWALERLDARSEFLEPLQEMPVKGWRLLDPTRPRRGPYDKRWMIQNNLVGRREPDEAP
ncbi:MAG: type IV toxin-antitoxin system AbiEi family antitoxin domain-containing protein [Deltaproteobacteria bacterium]|nr:type IV toxin-antitoxin system AbiEi family antitoxin domain-containing protein [Deltaproteobacteria bacterium]